jgi:beta-aspartyl-dipeptidase (metallo-type)
VPPVPLSRFTRAGVTTVVGVLGTDDLTRTPGELVAAARGLEVEGISAGATPGAITCRRRRSPGSVRGDIVHVDKIIGVGEVALSDHRSSQPTFDELAKLGAEAHVAGLMTGKAGLVHLHLGDGRRGLALVRELLERTELPARVWNPDAREPAAAALFDEAVALAGLGCTVDVTAFPVGGGDDDAWAADEAVVAVLGERRARRSADGQQRRRRLPARCSTRTGRVAHLDVGDAGGLADALAGARGARGCRSGRRSRRSRPTRPRSCGWRQGDGRGRRRCRPGGARRRRAAARRDGARPLARARRPARATGHVRGAVGGGGGHRSAHRRPSR